MWYRRYGKFNAQDYIVSWFVILFYLLFAVACYFLAGSFPLSLLSIALAVVRLLSILLPNCEQFSIQGDIIMVRRLGRIYKIPLPPRVVIVVSNTDICPPLSIRTAVAHRTHILHGQYSLSILQAMPLEYTLHHLHQNYVKEYTSSMIQFEFDEHEYVYSFVFNAHLLNQILTGRTYQMIIPESLLDTVPQSQDSTNSYVDNCF